MNPDINQENVQAPVVSMHKKSHHKLWILLFSMLALVVGLGGGYLYAAMRNDDAEESSDVTSNTTVTTAAQESTYTFSKAVGSPYNVSQAMTIQLGVPSNLQAVLVNSTIGDPGLTNVLANKFNDEMGRWLFDNPATSEDTIGELSVMHISSDWLAETDEGFFAYYSSSFAGDSFTTPDKKQATLAQLKTDTGTCVKDANTGFTMGNFNVCYDLTMSHQAAGTYDPTLVFKGYAEIDGEQYVLAGSLRATGDAEVSATEADKLAAQLNAGTVPSETATLVKEYIAALAKTTVTVTARQTVDS